MTNPRLKIQNAIQSQVPSSPVHVYGYGLGAALSSERNFLCEAGSCTSLTAGVGWSMLAWQEDWRQQEEVGFVTGQQ